MNRPAVLAFDVNETLSDTAALGAAFEAEGLPAEHAELWFARLLRDGFALQAAGTKPSFSELAAALLPPEIDDAAKQRLVGTFAELPLHPDVVPGLRALAELDVRLVTLSNGSAEVATSLLSAAGVEGLIDTFLGVDDGPAWKPAAEAYAWAAQQCGVELDQLMLVAVHPWDTHGATRAGARAAWLNRTAGSYPTVFTQPELIVTSLTDLAAELGRKSGGSG